MRSRCQVLLVSKNKNLYAENMPKALQTVRVSHAFFLQEIYIIYIYILKAEARPGLPLKGQSCYHAILIWMETQKQCCAQMLVASHGT